MAKRFLGIVVIVLIIAFGTLGFVQSQAKCYFAPGAASLVVGNGCTLNVQSGGTLDVDSGAIGAPVFGATANVVNGALVSHGLGTTPTAILLTPFYAGSLTNTLYVSATNATSFTVGLAYPSEGVVTITTVYWQAAK
jgi:hypothetical protein